jgi:hypothetical protein
MEEEAFSLYSCMLKVVPALTLSAHPLNSSFQVHSQLTFKLLKQHKSAEYLKADCIYLAF